jgi:CelD/BcsL family acetyltransferase involved in cellulose biosynthesis
MISFEIIRDKTRLLEYLKYWNQLFDSGPYEASISFEWTHALLDTHLGKDAFFFIVLKNSQEIVGIIPVVISKTKKYGVSLLNLFPISEYYNTHSDLLLKEPTQEMVKGFVEALFSLSCEWDTLRISRFIETNPLLESFERHLGQTGINYEINMGEPSFFLRLGDSYSDYLQRRSDKFRNYLRRMEKKLGAKGKVEFVSQVNYNSFTEAYDQVLLIEHESWKHNHGTAITSIEKQNKFYRKLCKGASERGWLNLSILLLDGEPVAYNMGLVKDKRYYYLKTSYKEKFRAVSPSTVLRARLIENLISEGIKEFDFPGEPYEWERQWTEELRRHLSLILYNKTFKARLYSIFNSFKNKRTKLNISDQFKYHDPRKLSPDKH